MRKQDWILDGARRSADELIRYANKLGYEGMELGRARRYLWRRGIVSKPARDDSAYPSCACAGSAVQDV